MTIWAYTQQGFWAFVATVGFAILFNVPNRVLAYCGLTGAVGFLCRSILLHLGAHSVFATFCGALAVGLMGYTQARLFHMPRLIFTVTGIIPMIPGVPAFETIVYFMRDDILTGVETLVRVIMLVSALGAGLMIARAMLAFGMPSAHFTPPHRE